MGKAFSVPAVFLLVPFTCSVIVAKTVGCSGLTVTQLNPPKYKKINNYIVSAIRLAYLLHFTVVNN